MSDLPGPPLLAIRNVSKHFGGTAALKSVDWDVAEGEVHCLVGENGCGKSTLIKVISGVYPPEEGGTIQFAGVPQTSVTPHLAKALGIEVIFQDLSLFPNLSVCENIAADYNSGSAIGFIDKRALRRRAQAAMDRIGAHLPLNAAVGALSVSQRQLVAICRGLASNARLLFMDEPTASLTRHEVEVLFRAVRRLQSQNVSIVFVSHRLEEILEIADRVTVMRDGRRISTLPARELDTDTLSELMTGETIRSELKPPATTGETVFSVTGLGRANEYEDISLTLGKGEVLGIIGLLGAGRTELALSLFGMTRPHRGTMSMEGRVVRFPSNRDAIAAGVAYVSEDRLGLGLNLRQSIADNIAVTVLDRMRDGWGRVSIGRRRRLAADWVGRLGVKAGSVRDAVLTLSGGNQQRIVLAKWLAANPKVLILDSPTVGVDVRNKKAIYETIHELAKNGVSIILISDEVSEVYFNSDRVLHMRGGRIVGQYLPSESSRQSLAEAVYA